MTIKELKLLKEIDSIEQEEVPNLELLENKKKEVKNLRGEKIKGSIIRSKAKWRRKAFKVFLYARKS